MTKTSMTESNQKLLWYKFPSPFSVKVCVVMTESLPWVLRALLQEPDPNHGTQSWPFLPFYVLFLLTLLHLSVLFVSLPTRLSTHVVEACPLWCCVHRTYLTACTYRHQWKCAQGRKEEKVAGRKGGAEGDWKQPNPVITTVFCQLMLWDVKVYDKIKLVSPQSPWTSKSWKRWCTLQKRMAISVL